MDKEIRSVHQLATLNSPTNHGGRVASTSSGIVIDGWPVALVGDKVACPIAGESTIVSGPDVMKYRGVPVAVVGSRTSGGATVVGSMQQKVAIVEYTDGSADVLTGLEKPEPR